MSADYLPYLETLRRIPGEIVVAMSAHTFDPGDDERCLCGVAAREGRARGRVARELFSDDACRVLYGGSRDEWLEIYGGTMDKPDAKDTRSPHIARAWAERVQEACAND